MAPSSTSHWPREHSTHIHHARTHWPLRSALLRLHTESKWRRAPSSYTIYTLPKKPHRTFVQPTAMIHMQAFGHARRTPNAAANRSALCRLPKFAEQTGPFCVRTGGPHTNSSVLPYCPPRSVFALGRISTAVRKAVSHTRIHGRPHTSYVVCGAVLAVGCRHQSPHERGQFASERRKHERVPCMMSAVLCYQPNSRHDENISIARLRTRIHTCVWYHIHIQMNERVASFMLCE